MTSIRFLCFQQTCLLLVMLFCPSAYTEAINSEKWFSLTFDNDIFVGDDSGYTNGMTFSIFHVAPTKNKFRESFLLKPLAWTLPKEEVSFSVSGHTFGQLMSTPSDISISDPPEGELPYAGLLFITSSYAERFDNKGYADRIATTVGLVGPISQAEAAQKGLHSIIGSEQPMGWDTQIENELVFQFSRARAWKLWRTKSDFIDLISTAEINIGTIESSLNTGIALRIGSALEESYPSLLFFTSRTSNPVSPNGWQFFCGLQGGYIFNQIFLDGNTFRDSSSIKYNPESVRIMGGYSYSFNKALITFALYDLNVLGAELEDSQSELTQFGTLTLAFKL